MSRTCFNPNGDKVCRKGCAGNSPCDYAEACNAYPRLVEALRYVSNGICTACVKDRAKTRQNVLRKLLAGPHPTDERK